MSEKDDYKRQRKYENASPLRKRLIRRAQQANNNAHKHSVPGILTYRDLEKLFDEHKYCLLCGTSNQLTVDHVVAMSLGGHNKLDNLQVLCFKCNSRKSQITMDCRATID